MVSDLSFQNQTRSHAEAREPGLQHHICLDVRNLDFVAFDQPAHPHSLISNFVIRYLKNKITSSDISYFSCFGA